MRAGARGKRGAGQWGSHNSDVKGNIHLTAAHLAFEDCTMCARMVKSLGERVCEVGVVLTANASGLPMSLLRGYLDEYPSAICSEKKERTFSKRQGG